MITGHRRLTVTAALLALLLILTTSAGFAQDDGATYEVTITNLTESQPLTPPLAATHGEGVSVYTEGEAASSELQQVAENGNLDPLQMALSNNMEVAEVVVTPAGDPPPLMPGQSVTFEIHAGENAQSFSFVSMLICTNDGFTGLDGVSLPSEMDGSATFTTMSYDAGTEMNTESFADLVPPCPALTGVESMAEGSGQSNPELAENGVVMMHPGIQGNADLDAMTHGWSDPVAEVTITYAGSMMMPESLPETGGASRLPVLPLATVVAGLLLLTSALVLRPRLLRLR